MKHPFAELLNIKWKSSGGGESEFLLEIKEKHFNPHGVVHGGVIYSLADTGMGAALYSLLKNSETCATIEIKINYFRPVFKSFLQCKTKIIYKGKRTASLESELFNVEKRVAKAIGTYAVIDKKV